MPWSLVEALAEPDRRRPFHLPLVSGFPKFSEVGQDQYDPENDHAPDPNDPSKTDPNDPRLRIVISPPQNGQFANQEDLPDPAIRLHAIGAAWVRFKPAHASYKDSLELKLAVFATFPLRPHRLSFSGNTFPLWWYRWLEAGCIPDRVIYENVDAALVKEALEAVRAPIDNQFENRVFPTLGLQFPYSVTQATRSEFIDHFMAGEQDYFMVAEAGAYLGAAARENATSTDPNAKRLLTLHALYHDHTETSPHPMNPLELFNLLFGNDSKEAQKHPLLLKIDAKGKLQSGHESKSMRIRPPLRTHARLMWEADIETVDHDSKVGTTPQAKINSLMWMADSNVQARFYNDFHGMDAKGTPRHFNRGTFDKCKQQDGTMGPCWKCNLFTFDVALRAGFRVIIHPVGSNLWHYQEPNVVVPLIGKSYANAGAEPPPRVPVRNIFGNGKQTDTLAWNIEGMLRSLGSSTMKDEINRQINDEGRCFVVAGSRVGNSGHMVLVESVLDETPTLDSSAGHGFSYLRMQTRGVTPEGAERREIGFTHDKTYGYSVIHLFELHPGKDPDTQLGLQDSNGAFYK
jgi:hypothetical protein